MSTATRVRIDRAQLMELVAKAPETFTLAARNPQRSVPIGGRHMVFVPTYGSPFVLDFDNRRRYSTLEDLHAFHKLAHLSASMHLAGGIICEPVDVAVPKRHLHVVYSLLKHSDKPFMGATTARERAEDTVAMARIAFGEDFVANHTVLTGVLNCNSPLVWDATMLDALKVYAANNQAVIASPFVMAGASTSASTAGAVAQLNAEALAGVAFAQLVRPGAPMIYGQFLATVDMQSGAPMAGTPEISLMNFMVGQLARRYRLPWRSSGMTAGVEAHGRAGRVRVEHDHAVRPPLGRELRLPRRGVARRRIERELREVRSRRGADGDVPPARLRGGHERSRRGARCGARGGAGRSLPRHRAHACEVRNRVPTPRSCSTTRASSSGRRTAPLMRTSGRCAAPGRCSAPTSPPPMDEAVDEALRAYIAKREEELPDGVE